MKMADALRHPMRRARAGLSVVVTAALLAGCAATPTRADDPLEPMNRALFQVNDVIDDVVLKPVVKVYTFVLPQVVRTGVSNFYNNIDDLYSAANDILQGKGQKAGDDLGRVITNTMFGFGLFDIASDAGIERGQEDLGQTFAVWGIGSGPYLFVPILGPSSGRDLTGTVITGFASPITAIQDVPLRNSLYAMRIVDGRYQAGDALDVAQTAALDRYSFIRNAYFQRRRYLIYDGKLPPEQEDKP